MLTKLKYNYLPELIALGIKRKKPGIVAINLTSRCNQHCIYCEIGSKKTSTSTEKLGLDDLYWIIDQMDFIGIRRMALCGGEPFLFEGMIQVISYAGKKNIRCAITTNGMNAYTLTEEEIGVLKSCHTEINISIDSFQEEIQFLTRGVRESLPAIEHSIQRLRSNNISVTVLTVISKYNFSQLFEILTTAFDHGIQQVLFQPVIYFSNYPDRPVIDQKPLINVPPDQIEVLTGQLRKILNFERQHNIKTNVYRILPWIRHYLKTADSPDKIWFFMEFLDRFYCREIDAIIDISYDGGIQACGLTASDINIHKDREKGLIYLWAEATQDLRNDMKNNRFHDACNGCCHHFSRNMFASIAKYPYKNRGALAAVLPLIMSRLFFNTIKVIYTNKAKS